MTTSKYEIVEAKANKHIDENSYEQYGIKKQYKEGK